MSTLPPALRLGGRYLLQHRLGEGGCGVVWQAWDEEALRPVAVKVLKLRSPQAERRLQREARITMALRHANIVHVDSVLVFGDDDEQELALVMELLTGRSLAAVIQARKALPLPLAAELFVPVLDAVEAAHAAGVVHRDLKPDNVFLSRESGRVVPKVLDFGVAKLTHMNGVVPVSMTTTATAPQMLLGTPAYMAPEQIVDGTHVDARADVWALGVMLFECLTGRLPYEAQNVGELFRAVVTTDPAPIESLAPELPADVVALVHGMLARDPQKRIAKVREVRRVLARHKKGDLAWLLEGKAKPSLRPSDAPFEVDVDMPTEVFAPVLPRRRRAIVAGAAVVVGAAAALVLAAGAVSARGGAGFPAWSFGAREPAAQPAVLVHSERPRGVDDRNGTVAFAAAALAAMDPPSATEPSLATESSGLGASVANGIGAGDTAGSERTASERIGSDGAARDGLRSRLRSTKALRSPLAAVPTEPVGLPERPPAPVLAAPVHPAPVHPAPEASSGAGAPANASVPPSGAVVPLQDGRVIRTGL